MMAKSFDYIFALALVFSVYGVVSSGPVQDVSTPQVVLLATRRITFDMNEMVQLIDELSEMEKGVASSPVSITLPLVVLLAFAHGYTKKQLMDFIVADTLDFAPSNSHLPYLRVESSDPSRVQYSYSARMFYGNNMALTDSFMGISDLLGVQSSPVDFNNTASAAEEINSIISADTHGVIPKAINSRYLNPVTDLMVISSMYFKGVWKCEFDASRTADLPFHRDDGVTEDVPTMWQVDFLKLMHSEELQSTVVVLPFSDEAFEFVLILPDENNLIKNISKKLQEEPNLLPEALAQVSEYIVEITMPKFILKTSIFMRETLEWLGVTTIMDDRVSNIKNIFADGHNAHITSMYQYVSVDVNEEGAEASSASKSEHEKHGSSRGYGAKPFQEVHADKPFLFVLRHEAVNFIMGSYQGNVSRILLKD